MSRPELYISLDIETDGPAPGVNSMLALGAVAIKPEEGGEWSEVGEWYKKFQTIPRSWPHPDTMRWWESQPEAWKEVMKDREAPDVAIADFIGWLEGEFGKYKLIAIGWPIAFDFAFVNYYCHAYIGRNPLGFAGLDIRSYINGLMHQVEYYGLDEAALRQVAGDIDREGLRPHVAVDDAIEQGRLFMSVRRYVIKMQESKEYLMDHNNKVLKHGS